MNNLKEDLIFLHQNFSTESQEEHIKNENGYDVIFCDGEPRAAIKSDNPEEYYYNAYDGTYYIDKLMKCVGIEEKVKYFGK
jgi:nucleoside-diphosphate-sugar epimerase